MIFACVFVKDVLQEKEEREREKRVVIAYIAGIEVINQLDLADNSQMKKDL